MTYTRQAKWEYVAMAPLVDHVYCEINFISEKLSKGSTWNNLFPGMSINTRTSPIKDELNKQCYSQDWENRVKCYGPNCIGERVQERKH